MSTIREVLTVFVGQAGTQISNACWELFCLEHGIEPDGNFKKEYEPLGNKFKAFFTQSQKGLFTPRTIVIDLEPTVIDEIRTGAYKELFQPDSLITGNEDAADNFARGYYSLGQEAIDITLDRIRKICENCSNLNAFIVFRSVGGGTGRGFTTLLLEKLSKDYPKKLKLDFAVYPAPNISTVIVEPYNAVLATHGTMDYVDCCFIVDNEALYDICARKLEIHGPMYTSLNRLQAQIVSNITASMRFESAINLNLEEIQTNLIPFPRLHFPLMAFAPIMPSYKAAYANISVQQITSDCFDPANHMVRCDPRIGAYLSCCLIYRGNIKSKSEINNAISFLKNTRSIRFVNWAPTGFKTGLNCLPTVTVPGGDLAPSKRTVTNLSNNTAIKHAWTRLALKFDLMCQKKAFFHHYLAEGMEEGIFADCRANISALLKDYNEVET
ncbi:Tubulin alpha chain [Camponotus floridanus]|uniref:Tubulin alpha chain n=1 Tax=Camponotus floridanus TaxID=104421 RepID=E2AF20_CAMFO|nr:Tubulin alpha chain [Camponotus floridanus]